MRQVCFYVALAGILWPVLALAQNLPIRIPHLEARLLQARLPVPALHSLDFFRAQIQRFTPKSGSGAGGGFRADTRTRAPTSESESVRGIIAPRVAGLF